MTTETKETNAVIVSITSNKLSEELLKAETTIRTADKAFIGKGDALTKILNETLYKERNCPTFEIYMSTIFDMTRDMGYKLINAVRIYHILEENFKPSELPRTETHCRPLTKIEKDADIIAIWSNVVASNKIIAKTVIEFVNQHLGKGAPTPTPEPGETVTNEGGDGGSVQGEIEGDAITAEQEVRVLKAEVTRLENELEKARAQKGGIAGTKMAREMIQKGFVAMASTVDDDQKEELIATKKALLGQYTDQTIVYKPGVKAGLTKIGGIMFHYWFSDLIHVSCDTMDDFNELSKRTRAIHVTLCMMN